MSRAFARRLAFIIGIGVILGVAISGTIMQRRSVADYSHARSAVRAEIYRYETLLVKGEPRARAVAALRDAGARVESPRGGDIVVTVLRELASSAQCRSLVGQLHVSFDPAGRLEGWESPPLNAECD